MKAFAELIDALVFMPSRNGKIRLLADYFANTPDPDRGYALAALTGGLGFAGAKPAALRALAMERVDPVLFGWSYDFVGDMAETISLIWPARHDGADAACAPTLGDVGAGLEAAGRGRAIQLVERWLDALDPAGRHALIKLMTGSMRVGVSGLLARTALAEWGGRPVDEIEEVWHGLTPPFRPLFDWLEGAGPRPSVSEGAGFRPLMLANALDDGDVGGFDVSAYRAEWKWDGIRVQLSARGGERRIWSRTGDDVSGAFPELVGAMDFDAVLDGELLVVRDGVVAPFNDLQQRLNRKTVTARMLADHPAHVRLYDILLDGPEDLRALPFDERRRRLEAWFRWSAPTRIDLSPMIAFSGWDDLAQRRAGARNAAIEGLMLKRGDSAYVAGRPKGPWFKWKRGPLTLDTVLMYAQRGHGKRSSYYSDFTFGAWRDDALVPVGKAYFGFTDEELAMLDRWVRNNTVRRYGPVREVAPGLVLEVAFDSVHRSARHKSGVAMRFPRVHRIRWDKPPSEADRLETLERMILK
ncbi:MAG TPA: cisplatin damage response ATP-dependent DNA ligase [Arenibaculum sp.]|nr:cisplatin damage response ATP-dependent DNA ligase [Arenibaculum sp.]